MSDDLYRPERPERFPWERSHEDDPPDLARTYDILDFDPPAEPEPPEPYVPDPLDDGRRGQRYRHYPYQNRRP